MTDNFDIIRGMLSFDNPDDCYYLQLLRRQADDPKADGNIDPAYHGNMHSRSLKDYFVHSLEHFDRIRPEVITLCETFNVRAYIRLNKRSYKAISLAMLKHIAEQAASGETYCSPFKVLASAAGKANCAGKSKTWILDLDEEYLPWQYEIIQAVCGCQPFQDADEMHIIPTKSGRHVICRPFNVKQLSDWWADAHPGIRMFDIHKDNPTILYVS